MQLTIDLTPELHHQLQARADERGITLLEVFEHAIDHDYLCPDRGIIPAGANVLPGDEHCRSLGHRELSWTEETEPTPTGGTRSWISEAKCTVCSRAQTQVRVVHPPERTITVHGPVPTSTDGSPD